MQGLTAIRFGLRQGDLSTYAGRCRLYDALWVFRPKHIWVSPKCSPWCLWNRLNATKSERLAQHVAQSRAAENVHLWMCSALCQLQLWRGDTFHFHLEQPQGSEMIHQKEMMFILQHTLRVLCDMCVAGGLRHPNSQEHLRKRTQVLTTSKIMHRMLERCLCVGARHHDVVAGSCKPKGQARMSVSKYTELYTAMFGRRLARAIHCSQQVKESRIQLEPCFVQETQAPDAKMTADNAPEPKRRRLHGKFSPEQIFVPDVSAGDGSASAASSSPPGGPETRAPMIAQAIHMAEQSAPRVGKLVVQQGPLFDFVQGLYPDKTVQVIDICRGVDRRRT